MIPLEHRTKSGRLVTVGFIDGKTAKKQVEKSKHLFRRYDSFGWALPVFEQIEKTCDKIVLHELEEDLVYHTTPAIFRKFGIIKGESQSDEEQIHLERNFFHKIDNRSRAESDPHPEVLNFIKEQTQASMF